MPWTSRKEKRIKGTGRSSQRYAVDNSRVQSRKDKGLSTLFTGSKRQKTIPPVNRRRPRTR